jgi:hypothetical protein
MKYQATYTRDHLSNQETRNQFKKMPRLNPALVQDAPAFNAFPNSKRIPSFSHHTNISQEAFMLKIGLKYPP